MSQTDSSSIASALRAGLTDDFLAKASEEADQQSSDSTWAECEKSNGLRNHELDAYGDQVAYEALRSAIVTTLTPVVEQMLAEVTKERDEYRAAMLKLTADIPRTEKQFTKSTSKAVARAELAERRLREIKKLKPQLEQWLARKAGNPTGWMSDGSAHALTQQAEPLLRDLLAQLNASARTEET